MILGTPYELPIAEDFEEGEYEPLAINPWAINYPTDACTNQKWNFSSMAEIFNDDSYTTNGIMGYQASANGAGQLCMSMPQIHNCRPRKRLLFEIVILGRQQRCCALCDSYSRSSS